MRDPLVASWRKRLAQHSAVVLYKQLLLHPPSSDIPSFEIQTLAAFRAKRTRATLTAQRKERLGKMGN